MAHQEMIKASHQIQISGGWNKGYQKYQRYSTNKRMTQSQSFTSALEIVTLSLFSFTGPFKTAPLLNIIRLTKRWSNLIMSGIETMGPEHLNEPYGHTIHLLGLQGNCTLQSDLQYEQHQAQQALGGLVVGGQPREGGCCNGKSLGREISLAFTSHE